uniref:hypothetical protein n=1 Tax=Pantanalinema rosaneae TaxID=1620701 RepID=UPI003D6F4A2C
YKRQADDLISPSEPKPEYAMCRTLLPLDSEDLQAVAVLSDFAWFTLGRERRRADWESQNATDHVAAERVSKAEPRPDVSSRPCAHDVAGRPDPREGEPS